ncbi:MAG: copper amine oxidase N-terminal domain-containing protein [Ruminococcaceae bacterium]|nr:copper amine oxidase N-terminal domain-containing protein [Oscillospiraceae bacterium]
MMTPCKGEIVMTLKKVFIALLISMCVSSFLVSASEASDVVIKIKVGNSQMSVNGELAEIDPGRNTAPIIHEGRTLIPIRSIIETIGGTVEWDSLESRITLKYKEDEINLKIGSVNAFFNGSEETIDVAPIIINERTMFPIRYIAEKFDFEVVWEGGTNIITISKKSVSEVAAEEKEEPEETDIDLNFEETMFEEDYIYDEFLEDEESLEDFYEEESDEI